MEAIAVLSLDRVGKIRKNLEGKRFEGRKTDGREESHASVERKWYGYVSSTGSFKK